MSHDLFVFAPEGHEPADLPADTARVEVDGPQRVEAEDVPEVALAAMLAPGWQVELHARHTKVAVAEARRLAKAIAAGCEGLVYDPQEDSVLWPRRGRRQVARPGAGERRLALVDLTWCLARSLTSADGERFLTTIARLLPEAAPRRWGHWEPLQQRGTEGFAAGWDDDLGLYWRAHHPIFDGHVHCRRLLRAHARPEPRLVDIVGFDLDADATVIPSPAWRTTVEQTLVTVAEELGAFFAAAHVERGWTYRNGHLSSDGAEQHTVVGRSWLGLPNFPCWLMWFGPAYRPLVAGAQTRRSLAPTGAGALLRLSESPLDTASATEVGLDARLLRPGSQLDDVTAHRLPPIEWDP